MHMGRERRADGPPEARPDGSVSESRPAETGSSEAAPTRPASRYAMGSASNMIRSRASSLAP